MNKLIDNRHREQQRKKTILVKKKKNVKNQKIFERPILDKPLV